MKFNKPIARATTVPNAVNEAGGAVFEMSERQKMINFALNANFQSNFYKSGDAMLSEIQSLIRSTKDPLFMAKLAVWARHEHGARPVSHVIAAELLKSCKNTEWMKNFINAVIYRPDDALEILGYYLNFYKKPIPNAFKRGVSGALAGFDEYQFAKYKKSKSEISLKDLVLLCHPKPSVKNHVAIEKLLNGTLKQINTAQAKLSEAGKKETVKEVKEARKEALNGLINDKKLGYSALIVNFIDICMESSDDEFNKACDYMTNETAIKNSLMYPMKYYILYKVLESYGNKMDNVRYKKATLAINKAIELSFKTVPNFEGKRILVAQDYSGSMDSNTISIKHGDGKNAVEIPIRVSEYASMFAVAMMKSNNNVDYCRFDDDAYFAKVNTADSFMTLVKNLSHVSGCTNMNSVFTLINAKRKAYDIILFITDNESYGHAQSLQQSLINYRRTTSKTQTILVTWDLAAKQTNPFNDKKAVYLSGYSAKVFEALGQSINEERMIEKQIDSIDFVKYIDRIAPWKGGRTLGEYVSKNQKQCKIIQKVATAVNVPIKPISKGVGAELKVNKKKSHLRAKKTL